MFWLPPQLPNGFFEMKNRTRRPQSQKHPRAVAYAPRARTNEEEENARRRKRVARKAKAMKIEGGGVRPRADRPSRRGVSRKRFADGGTPYSSPLAGGYVPQIQIVAGHGAPPPPPPPQQQSGPSLGDMAALAKGLNSPSSQEKPKGTPSPTVYNGVDYGDLDLAEAARTGVESGMSFDPATGDVWRRGGAVKSRRR